MDLDDYNDLHAFPIKTPESLHDFEEDDAFARQRLQGTFWHALRCRSVPIKDVATAVFSLLFQLSQLRRGPEGRCRRALLP